MGDEYLPVAPVLLCRFDQTFLETLQGSLPTDRGYFQLLWLPEKHQAPYPVSTQTAFGAKRSLNENKESEHLALLIWELSPLARVSDRNVPAGRQLNSKTPLALHRFSHYPLLSLAHRALGSKQWQSKHRLLGGSCGDFCSIQLPSSALREVSPGSVVPSQISVFCMCCGSY